MTETPQRSEPTAHHIISTLRELISALDRRMAQVGRPGELRIAHDALILRREAVARINALSSQGLDAHAYDRALANAIMTDDGCPLVERATSIRSAGNLWKLIAAPPDTTASDTGIR